jgi:hypothetical protein
MLNVKQIIQQYYSRRMKIAICFIYLNARQKFVTEFMEGHLIIAHKGTDTCSMYVFPQNQTAVNPLSYSGQYGKVYSGH